MRTVQLTLDEELVAAVNKPAARLGTTRSGFTRQALRQALCKNESGTGAETPRGIFAKAAQARRVLGMGDRARLG